MDNPYSPPTSRLSEASDGTAAEPARTVSRWLVAIQLVLIAIPATLLLSVFGLGMTSILVMNAAPENAGIALVLLIALAGLVAGWVLGMSFVVGGRRSLAARRPWLWLLAVGGGTVAILGLGARYVPANDYSSLQSFLNDLGMFALGLPLWLPLAHLAFEARRRK